MDRCDPPTNGRRPHAEIDPELIARALGGDTAAFTQLYAQTAGGIRRYVRTIIWNPWDAEDVTQEVFVKIFTGLRGYDPERAPFSAWALRIARNAAIDHMRRHRSEPGHAEVDQRPASDDAARQCRESLRVALGELNQNQREVLVLRALGGFTPREVATHAKATPGSINTLYHRARLAAQDRLRAMDASPSTRASTPRVKESPVLDAA
jgi:RNA polymerase sigma-70 factor, ECF subfamily